MITQEANTPEIIRKEILSACPDALEIGDREEAIFYTIKNMGENDILLIAGKGHEKTQTIGSNTIFFDDVEVAKKALS